MPRWGPARSPTPSPIPLQRLSGGGRGSSAACVHVVFFSTSTGFGIFFTHSPPRSYPWEGVREVVRVLTHRRCHPRGCQESMSDRSRQVKPCPRGWRFDKYLFSPLLKPRPCTPPPPLPSQGNHRFGSHGGNGALSAQPGGWGRPGGPDHRQARGARRVHPRLLRRPPPRRPDPPRPPGLLCRTTRRGGGCLDRRSWTPRTDGGSPHTSHSSVSPCTGRQ